MRLFGLAATLLFVFPVLATPTSAQEEPPVEGADDAGGDAAQQAFSEAVDAFSEHDYQRALGLFQQAYEISPHVDVLFNVARALERLGRFREASAAFGEVAADESANAGVRQEAAHGAEQLSGRLGTISTSRVRAGIEVSVDGEVRCHSPCESREDPGPHVVTLRDGDLVDTRRLSVRRGETIELAPLVRAVNPTGSTPAPAALPASESQAEGSLLVPIIAAGTVTVAAGALTTVFGLRANSLHEDYTAVGGATQELLDDGEQMVLLTNVSLAVAITAAATTVLLLVLDAL